MSWSVSFALSLTALFGGAGVVVFGVGEAARRWWAKGAAVARFARWLAPFLFFAAGMLALYGFWQYVLDLLVVHTAGATGRGRSIALLERHLHLPSEASLQRVSLHATWLVKAANKYYADVDFPALCASLAWLFARHRRRFPFYLAALIVATAICAFIQAIPVAPPRLVPGFGYIDTAARFHQLVYAPGVDQPGQLTTMPSVHEAWAIFDCLTVIGASPWRWRWWTIAHPVLTLYVVVVTGNHFWLDAAAGGGIVGVTFAIEVLLVRRYKRRHRPPGRLLGDPDGGAGDAPIADTGTMPSTTTGYLTS